MEDQEAWSSDANDAVEISLVRAGASTPEILSRFHPQFTYPIFGEEERIFGYRELKINLRFSAHDLYPNLEILYDRKFKAVGDTKATDIEETFKEWVPEISFSKISDFNAKVQDDATAPDWKPPGEMLETYSSKGRDFEIWSGLLTDPAIREIIARIQILISFFIEGGTPLLLEDQDWTLARWRVYFIYEKFSEPPAPNASLYSIVGYSTSYRFITYVPNDQTQKIVKDVSLPPSTPIAPSSLPARARISQFLILPSHHSHGHGTHLYNAMVKTFLPDPNVTEITLEDPNEAFDDLRDYCDYKRLQENGTFAQISLNANIDSKLSAKRIGVRVPKRRLLDVPLLENLRTKNKIAPRQFDRLVEMYLLSKINIHSRQAGTARLTRRGNSTDADDRAYYYWRLLVKQRIYKKNKDVLIQLDRIERIEKVEQAVGEQAGDFERLLREMGKFVVGERDSPSERRDRGKRKMVLENDEDEDMEEISSPKRARSEAL